MGVISDICCILEHIIILFDYANSFVSSLEDAGDERAIEQLGKSVI